MPSATPITLAQLRREASSLRHPLTRALLAQAGALMLKRSLTLDLAVGAGITVATLGVYRALWARRGSGTAAT